MSQSHENIYQSLTQVAKLSRESPNQFITQSHPIEDNRMPREFLSKMRDDFQALRNWAYKLWAADPVLIIF